MPGDWSITSNLSTPGTAVITVFGTSSDLPAGPQNVVKLIGNVPNTAPYTAAEVLRLSNITVSRNDASTITTRGDFAVHKVAYFGDADGNRAYTGSDAALISRVVVGTDTGFHSMRLVDPVIIADIDGSGSLTGIDASFVAQKAAFLPRPEIPDLPSVLPPLVGGGVDPLISGGVNVPGRPGGTANFPVNIDDATNTYGYNVVLDYNTSLIDVADDVSGVSPDVTLGSVYASAGGWSLVTNVDDASGHIVMVFWPTNGVPMPSGSGPIANVAAHVSNTAIHNQSIPVQASGPMTDQGLTFSHQDGNILVDAVAPDRPARHVPLPDLAAHDQLQLSENVSASLTTADLTVHNVTTSSNIPSGQFTLSYDSLNNIATFTYTGGTFLPDGDYTATLQRRGRHRSGGQSAAGELRVQLLLPSGRRGTMTAPSTCSTSTTSRVASASRRATSRRATSLTTAQWTCWTSKSWPESSARRSVRSRSSPRPLAECRGCRVRSRAARLAERSPPAATTGGGTGTASAWAAARILAARERRLVARIDRGSLPIPTAPSAGTSTTTSTSRTSSFSSTQVLASSVSPTPTTSTSGTTLLGATTKTRRSSATSQSPARSSDRETQMTGAHH